MQDRRLSHNVSAMSLSAIMKMEMLGAEMPGVASLAIGLPSFRTPEPIRQAASQHLRTNPNIGKYTLCDGLPELRECVAEFHHSRTGIAVDPDRHVVITAGNMQGLSVLFRTVIDPGDEVIMTDPGFASHTQQILMFGGVPIHWELDEADGWELDVSRLPEIITDRTKAIVLVSPSNPTGRIFAEASLRLCRRNCPQAQPACDAG